MPTEPPASLYDLCVRLFTTPSLIALYGMVKCSSRSKVSVVPDKERCLNINAIATLSNWKKLPWMRWLSMKTVLSVPLKRANRSRHWGYSIRSCFPNSTAAALFNTPFFCNPNFSNMTGTSVPVSSGRRPHSIPNLTVFNTSLTSKSCKVRSLFSKSSQRYWLPSRCNSKSLYVACGIVVVALSTRIYGLPL